MLKKLLVASILMSSFFSVSKADEIGLLDCSKNGLFLQVGQLPDSTTYTATLQDLKDLNDEGKQFSDLVLTINSDSTIELNNDDFVLIIDKATKSSSNKLTNLYGLMRAKLSETNIVETDMNCTIYETEK